MFEPIPRGRMKGNTYKIRRKSSSSINDRMKLLKMDATVTDYPPLVN